MSFNLLDSVKGVISNELVSKAAGSLGESESGIQKALGAALPSVLAGLLGKASNAEGASGILNMAKDAAGSGLLSNLGGFLGGDNSSLLGKATDMLKGLFGDKLAGISSLISNFAGIKGSSASSLLSMAAPAALGVLGNHVSEHNLNADGLMQMLAGQKASIINALPAGISSVAGMVGLGATTSSVSSHANDTAHAATHYVEDTAEKAGGGMKFLLPLFLGILAVALAIYLFKGCGSETKEVVAVTDSVATKVTATADSAVNKVVSTVRESLKVKLPNGTELDAYKGGIEDKLVAFLGTDYKALGADSLKKIWFDFDNLNFETGKASITTESQKQIDNITAILKAFPTVKLKIGGYTDKTGNEETNKKLSDERAKAVKAALDKAGVAAQVPEAQGYGSEFAKFPATASESDRVTDRHVSVSVRL
jgi:outer membrane protein OmpA-like peptidoglycan-associated protein